jgi:hypothetical protein
MPLLANSQHEAFAQARFAGKSLLEALEAAGLTGCKATASNLNRLSEVRERVTALYREAAAEASYQKTSAIRDLIAIIHACPSDAGPGEPLCETRLGKDGPYYRFPPKLQAMARLIKLMGWIDPAACESSPKNYFAELVADVRSGRRAIPSASSCASSSSLSSSLSSSSVQPSSDSEDVPDDTSSSNLEKWVQLLPDDASYEHHPNYTHGELTPRQEAFAQFRFQGMGVMEAYQASGYKGETANLASRLNSNPAVIARIAELNSGVETATAYHREDAIGDLIAIIHASPEDANADHPYCEMRMTSWGGYHRFPSKLGALTLLSRMLGWHSPPGQPSTPPDPNAGFKSLADFLSKRS